MLPWPDLPAPMRRGAARAALCLGALAAALPAGAQPSPTDSAVARMIRSTVQIRCLQDGASATVPMGSGVVLGAATTIVTNAHVLDGCEARAAGARVQVQAHDGSAVPATVVRAYPEADVAVLRLSGALPVAVATLRSDAAARVMEPVVAVGYPGLAQFAGVSGQQGRATIGVVSRLAAQDLGDSPRWVLEHGAPIYPGNSGGPLFDQCGAVLGINTFVPVDGRTGGAVPTIAYAIGARTVARLASEVTDAALPLGEQRCGTALPVETRTTMVGENARATSDARLRAFYARTVVRMGRWAADAERRAAARDSAVGDAIALVGEQAAAARRGAESAVGESERAARRVEALEARWTAAEERWQRELLLQRVLLAIVAVVATGAVGTGARALVGARRAERGVDALRGDVAGVRAAADDALALAQRAMAAAQQAAERQPDARLREEAGRIWAQLDRRPSHSVLQRPPQERTRWLQGDASALSPAAVVSVQDASGERLVELRDGATLYLGRDEGAMRLVAQRYVVPHTLVTLRERDGECVLSRCHCTITNRDGALEVVDLSTNGTFVGDAGTRLQFGEARVLRGIAALSLARHPSPYRLRVGAPAPATARLN